MIRHELFNDNQSIRTIILSGNGTLGLLFVDEKNTGHHCILITDQRNNPWQVTSEAIANAKTGVILEFTTLDGLEAIKQYFDYLQKIMIEEEKINKLRLKP